MAGRAVQRTNDEWLQALREEGSAGSAAQEELRELVAGAVRKASAAKAKDDATIDDLTQVATVHVLRHLDRFEGRSKFTTWAYAVAVRAAFTELRRPAYRSSGQDSLEDANEAEAASSPASRAERGEIVEVMHRVIAEELTDRQRAAILGELEGRSQEELLAELGTSRNAFYKLVHDARKKLESGLGAAGICDDQVREAFDL